MSLLEIILRSKLSDSSGKILCQTSPPVAPLSSVMATEMTKVTTCTETLPQCPTSKIKLPELDPYAERLRAALRRVSMPDYPTGMVSWINTARPDLYTLMTAHFPNEIQKIWNERGPLDDFDAALARLIALHQRCCDLYVCGRARAARATSEY